MSLRYGILSLLAFFIILLLVFKNYEIWTLPVESIPEKTTVKKPGSKTEAPPAAEGPKGNPPVQPYLFVAEKNVFSPERKEFPIFPDPAKAASEVKKPVVRPQIILYGVTILGDYQAASVSNPGRPLKKGERELMTLKIGESVGEYKLAKIMPDRVTMEAPGDTFDVMLYTQKQRAYVKTEVKPAAVTSTLPVPPAPAGAATPPRRVGTAQEPERGRVVEAPIPRPVTPVATPPTRTRRWFGPSSPTGTAAPGGSPAPVPIGP